MHFHGPRDAVNAGLGMVHQHFMLIPRFTVTENVILGNEGPSISLDRRKAERTVGETAERYGLRVDPKALIENLPVGMQQRVEILRVLYQRSRTLILDEPTALLTPQEVEELYAILLQLRESGHTIIFITHKLREVAAISDRVTVIRRGKTVGTRETQRHDLGRARGADGGARCSAACRSSARPSWRCGAAGLRSARERPRQP